jgi:acyl-CoA-binding protein
MEFVRRHWSRLVVGGAAAGIVVWVLRMWLRRGWSASRRRVFSRSSSQGKQGRVRRRSIGPPPNLAVDTGFKPIAQDEELEERFLAAADRVRNGEVGALSDEMQLQVYGLYKQATVGAASKSPVPFWDVVGKAKFDAWSRLGSLSKREATLAYVELIDKLGRENGTAASSNNGEGSGGKSGGWKATSKMLDSDMDADEEKGFLYFCREGNIGETLKLLQSHADLLELRDAEGTTGLLWACDKGHLELVVELLNAGADIQQADLSGLTPLHYASLNNREELVKLLLSRGADTEARDNNGATPRELADLPAVVSLFKTIKLPDSTDDE